MESKSGPVISADAQLCEPVEIIIRVGISRQTVRRAGLILNIHETRVSRLQQRFHTDTASLSYGVAVRCDGFKVHVKRIYNKDCGKPTKT